MGLEQTVAERFPQYLRTFFYNYSQFEYLTINKFLRKKLSRQDLQKEFEINHHHLNEDFIKTLPKDWFRKNTENKTFETLLPKNRFKAWKLLLLSALSTFYLQAPRTERPMSLYRGHTKEMIENLKNGKNQTDFAFISTGSLSIATSFLKGKNDTILKVLIPAGTPYLNIQPSGYHLDESEILLLPGTFEFIRMEREPYYAGRGKRELAIPGIAVVSYTIHPIFTQNDPRMTRLHEQIQNILPQQLWPPSQQKKTPLLHKSKQQLLPGRQSFSLVQRQLSPQSQQKQSSRLRVQQQITSVQK